MAPLARWPVFDACVLLMCSFCLRPLVLLAEAVDLPRMAGAGVGPAHWKGTYIICGDTVELVGLPAIRQRQSGNNRGIVQSVRLSMECSCPLAVGFISEGKGSGKDPLWKRRH